LVSLWEWRGTSLALLQGAGLTDPQLNLALIVGGAGWDLALGWALLCQPSRTVAMAAGGTVVLFTALATWLTPEQWLHPLGPLLKNIPILTLLWLWCPDYATQSVRP
jgi:hypothetical protein